MEGSDGAGACSFRRVIDVAAVGKNARIGCIITLTWSPPLAAHGDSLLRTLSHGYRSTARLSLARASFSWSDGSSATMTEPPPEKK